MLLEEHKSVSIEQLELDIRASIYLQTHNDDVAIPFLQGPPGGAKTAIVKAWAEKYGWNLLSVHFSLIPIEEIAGIPQFETISVPVVGSTDETKEVLGTVWSYPEILTRVFNLYQTDPKKPIVIFLDDFHLCSPDHLNLGFEMFTNRAIRGYSLPTNSAFLLAGNMSTKSGTKTGNSAIVNRCAIYPVHLDFKYWKKAYAAPHGVNYKILSFLSNDKYSKFFHMEELTNKPWGSPRAWTRFSNVLNPLEVALKGNIPFQMLQYRAEAHIGTEAASEFTAYYKLYLETEMDKIFDGKKEIDIPNDMTGQYIFMLSSCGELFNRMGNKDKNYSINPHDKFAEITLAIAEKSLSIATVGAREVVDGGISLYKEFRNRIVLLNPAIANKIAAEIAVV